MWPHTFADRLTSWNQMRSHVQNLPLETALKTINDWWSQSPWQPYYLHWDDSETWPDPWQLLSDNLYCYVARALGILYTISLLDRVDMADATMVLTEDGYNLVLVGKTKYILNWEDADIVNKNLTIKIKRQYQQHKIT